VRIVIVQAYWDFKEVAYELPQALAREGHEPYLLGWSGSRKVSRTEYCEGGFKLLMLPGLNLSPFGRQLKYPLLVGLEASVQDIMPSVIDCQSHLFPTAPESLCIAKKNELPLVITINGIMAKRDIMLNMIQESYLHTVARSLLRQASAVRCLNSSDAAEAIRYGCPPQKITVIPNFVNTDLFSPEVKVGRKATIAWSGRFVAEKDVQTLVRAAKIVLRKRPDAEFVLMGDGPLKPKVEALVEQLGIRNRFTFTGSIGRRSVAAILKRSATFVLPSLKEGMPLSLLEAMSCGKAVVGSNIPGITELVRNHETGLLVPARDVNAFANAIINILDDEGLRERLGSMASKLIRQKYSHKIVVRDLIKLYSAVSETCNAG